MNGFEIMLVWAIYCCPVPLYVMNGEDSIGTAPIANGLIYSEVNYGYNAYGENRSCYDYPHLVGSMSLLLGIGWKCRG